MVTMDSPRFDLARGPRPPERWVVTPSRPDGLIPEQRQVVIRGKAPDTAAGWQDLAEGLLTTPAALHAHAWPRITRLDDRWRWLLMSVVPRFRRLEADARLIGGRLQRICDEARDYASMPCVLPIARQEPR
jgi:hypothetical protein